MPIQFPDGVYDYSHPWQSNAERQAGERAFGQDPIELAKIQQALVTADPATPEQLIQLRMTTPLTAERDEVIDRTPLTVEDCFGPAIAPNAANYAPTNFSGRQSEFSGTSTPSMPHW